MGHVQSIVGYFVAWWPLICGHLALQVGRAVLHEEAWHLEPSGCGDLRSLRLKSKVNKKNQVEELS